VIYATQQVGSVDEVVFLAGPYLPKNLVANFSASTPHAVRDVGGDWLVFATGCGREACPGLGRIVALYHAFGLIGTALSKKTSIFQSSSLKVVPISPNASYHCSSTSSWNR
jgi:hypothetical protein